MNGNQISAVASRSRDVFEEDFLPYATLGTIENGNKFSALVNALDQNTNGVIDNLKDTMTIEKPLVSTIGEKLFSKLDAMGSEFKSTVMKAHEEMEKAPDQLTLRDILKLQYEFAVITLQIDVVSKGVQKAVQNVDTLVKIQ